jgi:hypothetical protein
VRAVCGRDDVRIRCEVGGRCELVTRDNVLPLKETESSLQFEANDYILIADDEGHPAIFLPLFVPPFPPLADGRPLGFGSKRAIMDFQDVLLHPVLQHPRRPR